MAIYFSDTGHGDEEQSGQHDDIKDGRPGEGDHQPGGDDDGDGDDGDDDDDDDGDGDGDGDDDGRPGERDHQPGSLRGQRPGPGQRARLLAAQVHQDGVPDSTR